MAIFNNIRPRTIDDLLGNQMPTTDVNAAPVDLELPARTLGADNSSNDLPVRMNQLYQPENENINRMNSMLDQFPVRNHPGKLRQIFGGIAQALGGGPEANEAIRYAPYRRDLEDFNAKFKPIENAAGIERQNNANMRMVASQILNNDIQTRRLEETSNRNRVLANQGDRRLDDTEARNKVLEEQGNQRLKLTEASNKIREKAANGGTFQVDDQGNGMIVYRDGKVEPVEEYSGMSFSEKQKLRNEGNLAVAKERVKINPKLSIKVTTDPTTGDDVYSVIDLNTATATPVVDVKPKTTNETKPAAKVPVKEIDKGRALLAKVNAVRLSNPQWAKWITIDEDKNVQITKPGMSIFGSKPTEDQYNEMYQAIYGGKPTVDNKAPNNNSNIDLSKYPQKLGKTLVSDDKGNIGYYPTEKVSQMPKGYKVLR